MADKHVDVIVGPYRGKRLTMPEADATAAINDHWAVDPVPPEVPDEPHDPLTDEERTHALEAANTWAKATWDAAAGIEPPPPPEGGEGGVMSRAMGANEPGRYPTRGKK